MSLTNRNQNSKYSDFIEEMKDIYDELLEFIDNIEASDEDFTNLVQNIENKGLNENKEVFNNFIKLLVEISNNHHRENLFFDKLERIVHQFEKSLKANNTNQEIYLLFESNKRLLYFLIKEKIITIDEEIKQLIDSHVPRYSDFFFPEIEKDDNDKTINNDDLIYCREHLEEYESKRRAGENDSYICSLIREDSIEEFVTYVNKTNTSVSSKIEPSIFETNSFLINNKPTLIEYAAFFGSIQIFQYLYLNEAKVSDSMWFYAIHSNNSDLLRNYIENYDIKPTNDKYDDVFIECIKCHHNEIAKYIEDNLITHEDRSQQESFDQQVYESILKYHNYSFFPTKFNKSYSFYYLFKYDYQFITKILIQTCQTIIQENRNDIIFRYCSIYYISETTSKNQKSTLLKRINESEIVFINIVKHNFNNDKDLYLYIGIKNSIIFIKLISITLLLEHLRHNRVTKFCILNDENTKELIEEFTTNQSFENYIDNKSLKKYLYYDFEDLYRMIRDNPSIDFVFNKFHQVIQLFLITEAINKINKRSKNRIEYFISDYKNPSNTPTKIIKNDNFIEIYIIGIGCYHRINLVYYIDKKEMMAIKYLCYNECEVDKLFHRERLFYEKMKHPYLPKFYGIIENNDKYNTKMIITEFINGKSLNSIEKLHLEIKDKIIIIFKLMIIIEYIHRNKFIYRDLSPSHVMIDNNKEVILVGFSRVIKYDRYLDDEYHTRNFGLVFVAPEVNYGKISFKNDIYSLGMMIKYIMKEERPNYLSQNSKEEIFQYPEINQMIQNCINESPEERPCIYELIIKFYFYFHTLIDIGNLIKVYEECFSNVYDIKRIKKLIEEFHQNHDSVDFNIGMLYYEAELCPFDYNKSIQYFQQASKKYFGKANQILDIISKNKDEPHNLNQSQIRAQINLGYFYLNQNEIDRSIHFFTLVANQNNPESQHQLGLIYYENKFVRQDINKAIHYFTLAANQNNPESQHQLGLIYYENKFVRQDINKAIHYFTLAANQNKPESQHQLGLIYYENKFIQRDILKAIEFFSHAEEQNYVESQLMLGKIYYENKYVQRDAHNVIYYYSRAAEQKNVEALRFLGQVYYNDELVYRDIQNSIYYLRIASNQNDSISQFLLGDIYYENEYIERDIDKAIYYFTLSANQNNSEAEFKLGVIYFEGKFVPRDLSRAKSYFSMSAKQNHQNSIYYLTTLIPKSNI